MQIRGILFDKDGTLLDFDCYWVSVARAATVRLLRMLSFEAALAEPMLEAIGVHGDVTDMDGALCYGTFQDVCDGYEATLRGHGIAVDPVLLYRMTVEAYHACADQGIIAPTCENLPDILRELRGRGIKLALATADDPVLTELCLRGLGISELFDRVYTSDGIHPPKPDPYYIHRFAEDEGLAAEDMIMVGDTMNDIRFAQNGGIAAVGVAKTEENRRRLKGAADVILPDVSFLAGWIDGGCQFQFNRKEETGMERNADFVLNAEVGKPYRILQITDMQVIDASQQRRPDRLIPPQAVAWETEKVTENCFDPITKLVDEVKPDLILITGDIVYGEFDDSGESLNRFLAFMGTLDTPWAPVFGNHDNESKIGVAEQCRRYAAAKNCLFRRGDVTGNSNYTVGIREGDRLVRVLYMADSNGCGNCSDPEVRREHGFGEDQLEWIRDTAAALKAPGFFCCHIPTADAVDAFVECGYQSAETLENPTPFVIGETVPAHHPEDFGYKNERIVERGCTQRLAPLFRECGIDGAFYGHFHKINTSILYEGIRYTFGVKTGTYDYHTPGKLGGTLITLEADRSRFTVEHLYRA